MNIINHPDIDNIVNNHFSRVCKKLKVPDGTRYYAIGSVYNKLDEMISKYSGTNTEALFVFFKANHEDIIKGKPATLDKISFKVDRILKQKKLQLKEKDANNKLVYTQLYNDIKECFDYDKFVDNEHTYKLLSELNFNTCPYCNRQYINTFYSEDGKTRATIDHFYSRYRYPYLGISFYNLIPSCYSCNSSIKGKKQFSIQSHVHPYVDSFENIMTFTINYKKLPDSEKYIAEFYLDDSFLEIDIIPRVNRNFNSVVKSNNNIKAFKLINLYNLHKDIVVELLQKEVLYNHSGYATNLKNAFPKIFNEENDVKRVILGNYFYAKDFNKRPFSRLIRDLSVELNLSSKTLL